MKKIAVLMGGQSSELEVSLLSGHNVAEALKSLGKYEIVPVDLTSDSLAGMPTDVDADGDLLKVRVEISDNDGVKYSVPAFSLTGDIGEGVAPGTNKHIVWDAGTDWDGEYSDKMRVKVFAIDAKGFPGMEWSNEVKPGGFLLGQDGGAEGAGESQHVNIKWSYWMTKYEITNAQYCDFLNAAIVAGIIGRNEAASVYATASMPVSYACPLDAILCYIGDDWGIRWNVNNFEVVSGRENLPAITTWYGAMAFCRFYGYDRCRSQGGSEHSACRAENRWHHGC